MTKLANEYRETMDAEVLHSWARDAVEEIRRLEAENAKLKAENERQKFTIQVLKEGQLGRR